MRFPRCGIAYYEPLLRVFHKPRILELVQYFHMAHPLIWPKKSFFYPIGNTSAVCLTQGLAPDEPANVLLLGCGDPRNILFTIYSSGADTAKVSRKLDFTCCDVDPAILARNALLFTLLADGEPIAKIWNIFFHFYVDQSSLSLLLSQCRKLIEMSIDINTWGKCPYAYFLRMCTSHTLAELRRHWVLYVETENLSDQGKAHLERKFRAASKAVLQKTYSNLTACRSAGPLFMHAGKIAPKHFTRFWKKGMTSEDPADANTATCINPTFAYSISSGEELALHYGTDPLLPFHLAVAFAPLKTTTNSPTKHVKLGDVVHSAQVQFQEWCEALKALLVPSPTQEQVVIRLFAGDAIAFCNAMHYCFIDGSTNTSVYAAQWGGSQIIFDGGGYKQDDQPRAPLIFNVIDTSNLTDHIGLLNVLISAIPLLSRTPSSTLYTEALLPSSDDPTSGFADRVCANIPVMSFLLGLIPSTYLSNFTTHSNIHEILPFRLLKTNHQFHERLAWKTPYMGDPVAVQHEPDVNRPAIFNPKQLAECLFGIYLKMFINEDHANTRRNLSLRMISDVSLVHYVRGTFAALLRIVKDRVRTNWAEVMDRLCGLIEDDRTLMMGLNNYQDLCCQLYIRGVYAVDVLVPGKVPLYFDKSKGRLREWAQVPPVICVVLVVPRKHIKVLENIDPNKVGTPALHCETTGTTSHAIYSSVQAVFGTAKTSGSKADPKISLQEDPAGWSGSSPLVVSFWIPTWNLMVEPHAIRIGLSVRSTPATAMYLIPVLGFRLNLFTAQLSDENHVHLARERPDMSEELSMLSAVSFGSHLPPESSTGHVVVALDNACRQLSTFTIKKDVAEEEVKNALSAGAVVTIKQISACTVQISIGEHVQILAFPYPIDDTRQKVRVARKSLYIEAIVFPSGPRLSGGFSYNRFPLILKDKIPTLWNVHRLNLDRLPALDTSKPNIEKLGWLTTHISLMFSDRERAIRDKSLQDDSVVQDVMVDVKDGLFSMFIMSAGVQRTRSRVFGLTEPSMGGIYTMIFVTDLRMDLASHTLVADACVLPLTEAIMPLFFRTLQKVTDSKPTPINTSGAEMVAWKRLLPVITERCREWAHKENCAYARQGSVPLSLEYAEDPICACGRGIGTDEFVKMKQWKDLAPYVTRAAIGPLFAVSYLETVAGTHGEMETREFVKRRKRCASCGKPGQARLLVCSKCQMVCYCSAVCQKADWRSHKAQCSK